MEDERTGRAPDGDWPGTPFLRFERHGSLVHLVVDRPDRRNAMSPAMYFGVRHAIDHLNRSPELAGMLITGSGDVFVPGGDMGGENVDGWADLPSLLGMDTTPFEAVRRSPKPIVCAVNGLCQGGGLMIAMLSDVAVVSERATFRAPELLRGIADTNFGQVLPRQVGPARARDLLMTGREIDAATAVDWGIAARMAAHDELIAVATGCLEAACRAAPAARLAVKRSLHEYYGHHDRIAMDESLAGDEPAEGFVAFKEGRNPSWVPGDLDTGERI